MTRAVRVGVLAAVASTLLLAACGVREEPVAAAPTTAGASTDAAQVPDGGPEIAQAAAAALEDAGSVHVVETMDFTGIGGPDPVGALGLHAQGDDAALRVVAGEKTYDMLIVLGECTWMRMPGETNGPDGYWGLPWIGIPTAPDGPFGPMTVAELAAEIRGSGDVEADVGADVVGDEHVLRVSYEDGSTLSVRAEEPYWPVLLERVGRDGPPSMEFDSFGEPVEIAQPADVVPASMCAD